MKEIEHEFEDASVSPSIQRCVSLYSKTGAGYAETMLVGLFQTLKGGRTAWEEALDSMCLALQRHRQFGAMRHRRARIVYLSVKNSLSVLME